MALFKITWQPSKAELHDYLQVKNVYIINFQLYHYPYDHHIIIDVIIPLRASKMLH